MVFSGDEVPGLGTSLGAWPAALLMHHVTWLNFGSASVKTRRADRMLLYLRATAPMLFKQLLLEANFKNLNL